MEPLIRLGRCLSDPRAVRVLAVLSERNVSLTQLQREFGVSAAVLESRLRKLREAGLIESTGLRRNPTLSLAPRYAAVILSILADYSDTIDWDYELTAVRNSAGAGEKP